MRAQFLTAAAMGAAIIGNPLPVYAGAASDGAPGAAQSVEPGKVGPGSENNATISPTSPDIPISKQPPPEISLPAKANTGASTGEKGSGPEGTSPPHNPAAPGLQ